MAVAGRSFTLPPSFNPPAVQFQRDLPSGYLRDPSNMEQVTEGSKFIVD